MKTILIHGDDTTSSRKRFSDILDSIKKRGWKLVIIDKESSLSLSETLTSNSLFPEDTLYVIETITKVPEKELKWLANNTSSLAGNLLLYHNGVLAAKYIKALPKDTKPEVFNLPKLLFVFLEAIKPGASKLCLRYMQELKKTTPVELLLAMIARQMRDLYWLKSGGTIPSTPQWKIAKIQKQSQSFSLETLSSFITNLARIDVESKTGGPPLDISLDLTIAKLLQ